MFAYKPEVLSAIHDREVSHAEVAVLLARLELEGKVKSTVHTPDSTRMCTDPRARALAPPEWFSGYERKLIKPLFSGKRKTSTQSSN